MSDFLTLMQLKNLMEPGDAAIAGVAEVLAEENDILADVPFTRGNLLTGDRHMVRAAMPSATKRKINEGVEPSTSKTEPHEDTCIELTSRGVVDMRVLDITPDKAKLLLSENKPHIAVLGEDFADELFYGNDANGIRGFATRLGSLKTPQVIDARGVGDNLASIYFIKWDSEEVTGIYPKNATAGLQVNNQANVYVAESKANPTKTFRAHVSDYSWFVGLKLRDIRYVSRVANIDRDTIPNDEALQQKLFEQMIQAKNKIRHVSNGRVVCYVDPNMYSWLEVAAFKKSNLNLGYKEIQGDMRMLSFAGIPIRQNDCQSKKEPRVS